MKEVTQTDFVLFNTLWERHFYNRISRKAILKAETSEGVIATIPSFHWNSKRDDSAASGILNNKEMTIYKRVCEIFGVECTDHPAPEKGEGIFLITTEALKILDEPSDEEE